MTLKGGSFKTGATPSLDAPGRPQTPLQSLLEPLWITSRGDPRIRIALLDGVVDLSDPALAGCTIEQRKARTALHPRPSKHATAIATLLFGRSAASRGISPSCTGISVPIFAESDAFSTASCSEDDLALAVEEAIELGAHVINVSASSATPDGRPSSALERALRRCESAGILVVAATGNRGPGVLSLPAAFETVLAVGALGPDAGVPAPFAGWRPELGPNAILAPGEGVARLVDGTSAATAVVSGVAALLLSAQIRAGGSPTPLRVRSVLVSTSGGGCIEPLRALDELLPDSRDAASSDPARPAPKQGQDVSASVGSIGDAPQPAPIQLKAGAFGSTEIETFAGRVYRVNDLCYRLHDGSEGVHVAPLDEASSVGSSWVDSHLRALIELEPDTPYYALLTYTRPDETHVPLSNLLGTYKRRLGYQHVGAYLGDGRTTHALPRRRLQSWTKRGNFFTWNVSGRPANVHVISLRGTSQAVLNRNLQIVDLLLFHKLEVPEDTELLSTPAYSLATCLRYYRDLLSEKTQAPPTNCADHKFLVVNIALNVPHNPAAFAEIFGEAGAALWDAFLGFFERAVGRVFNERDSTAFVPLWQLEGFTAAEVRAGVESIPALESKNGFRAVTHAALAWPPETAADVVASILDTYLPFDKVSGVTGAVMLATLQPLMAHVLKLNAAATEALLRPIYLALLEADARRSGSASSLWQAAALAQLESDGAGLKRLQDAEEAKRLLRAHVIEIAATFASPPSSDPDASAWLARTLGEHWAHVREAVSNAETGAGYFHTPGAVSRVAAGKYPRSAHVTVRTVCTVMSADEIKLDGSYHFEPKHPSGTIPATENSMSQRSASNTSSSGATSGAPPAAEASDTSAQKSSCACQTGEQPGTLPLVYALGQLGCDVISAGRHGSLSQIAPGALESPGKLIELLERSPWIASSLQWVLVVEGTPVYVIAPEGPFARDAYDVLRECWKEQVQNGTERVSIPGYITGSQRLRAGYVVPTINPEIRGIYNWTTSALVQKIVTKKESSAAAPTGRAADVVQFRDTSGSTERVAYGVTQFLERVYFELRNPGRSSQERAINFAATNAFQLEHVYETAIGGDMELDLIEVEPNPLARPGSDCWDVKLTFFSPSKDSARRLFRFTVDVSDVVPSRIGEVRSWAVR